MKKISLLLLLFTAFQACKTPDIRVHPELKAESTRYEVKGRQGWMINQVVTFGEYTTSRIKRGWTVKYDLPFIVRFQGASEKLSYTQYDADSNRAEVSAIGKFRNTELPIINDYFGIPLDYKHYFAGTVYVPSSGRNYDFILYNPTTNWVLLKTNGYVKGNQLDYNIVGVRKLEGKKYWGIENLGYEFYDGPQARAAVEVINNGKVWLHDALSQEHKLVMAAVATALMIRNSELDEPIEQIPPTN